MSEAATGSAATVERPNGMEQHCFAFRVNAIDVTTAARQGTLDTGRGAVETPVFMPVGTLGTVKGLTCAQLRETGARILLANTYHLALRPGEDIVKLLGGLHRFSGWDGPLLTDSGGFQLFSLAQRSVVRESGATFRSHIDGRELELSPERAVAIQETLGSDIAMVLDHVVALPSPDELVHEAWQRSVRWAQRCQKAARCPQQALFAIVQGGLNEKWRVACAQQLVDLDFPGYAIGGLSVGEAPGEMYQMLDVTVPHLPGEKPRYLMGVGRPVDLLEGIARGIDMFDCVMPSRNGRNALAFTDQGTLRLRNKRYIDDPRPVEEGCGCVACQNHSRGYIAHLFRASEMLGPILLTVHNLHYYQRLMREARTAILEQRYATYVRGKKSGWAREGDEIEAGPEEKPTDPEGLR